MAAIASRNVREVLENKHLIYRSRVREWRTVERRLRGGADILQELQAFDYAPIETAQYRLRANRARYINFPDDIASMIVGHVMQAENVLSFGTLGEVKRMDGQKQPSNAELVYYNTDGVGNDASQWPNFWAKELRMSMATGHRWEYVDSPGQAAKTRADVLAGQRPFIVGLSPTKVTDWEFQNNILLYAVIRHRTVHFAVDDPRSQRHPAYTLLVREGFGDFGPDFVAGGWWNYDVEGNLLPGQTGNWSRTLGDIPMTPLYYQRDDGSDGDEDGLVGQVVNGSGIPTTSTLTPGEMRYSIPSMSKSGLFELGQLAVDYMNTTSGQSSDLWNAAASELHIIGTTPEAYKQAKKMKEDGSMWIAWDRDEEGNLPTFHDSSTGVVIPGAFKVVQDQMFAEVRYLANRELGISDNASGTSKQASFTREQSPKLSNMASEYENAANACIRWLEMRWPRAGGATSALPTGSLKVSRKFDIIQISTNVAEFLELQAAAGIESPTLTKDGLMASATELGLMGDNEKTLKISQEFDEAIVAKKAAAAQAATQSTQSSALAKDFATASTRAVEQGSTR